ncbi:hypothetical protein [Kibdelosporangium philippinense]|nr:hypothetical protein [Kibdelosporangium philippinense]
MRLLPQPLSNAVLSLLASLEVRGSRAFSRNAGTVRLRDALP